MLMLRDEQEKCCESKQARRQSGRDCALSPRPESLLTAALRVLLRSATVVHGGTLFFAVFFGSSIIRLYGNTCGLDPLRPSTWTRAFMVMGSPWCRSLHWLACSATYVVDHMWCVCVVVQHRTISWSSHPLTTLLTPPQQHPRMHLMGITASGCLSHLAHAEGLSKASSAPIFLSPSPLHQRRKSVRHPSDFHI